MALDPDPLAGGDAGRNRDFDRSGSRHCAGAVAAGADRAANEALAVTGRAGFGRLDVEPALRPPERLVERYVDRLLEVGALDGPPPKASSGTTA